MIKESLMLTDYQIRIDELALLQKGWYFDGQGQPVSSSEVSMALTVLDTLCKNHPRVNMPIINPIPDGGLSFEWDAFEIYITDVGIYGYHRFATPIEMIDIPLEQVVTQVLQWTG